MTNLPHSAVCTHYQQGGEILDDIADNAHRSMCPQLKPARDAEDFFGLGPIDL